MGSDLQCSRIAFSAAVKVFDVLILSGALFHTLAPSHVKLFFAFVDLFFFFWTLVSVSLQFIHCHVAGFYKPTIPQSPPSHLQDYSICNNAKLEFSTNFVPSFDPIEWCLKNDLHSGGSNSQPFSHESSALTTRPRLLACFCWSYNFCKVYLSKTSSFNSLFLSFSCLHFYWVLWFIN